MIERSSGLPDSWNHEVDFVVVGSGSAGMTGATVAAAEGASVIVLEKAALAGGTSAISGGGFWIPVNDHMVEVGVEDNREDALTYLRACAGGAADEENLSALVDTGSVAMRYLEERVGLSFRAWPGHGATIDYRPELPGSRHGGRTLDAGHFRVTDLGDWAPRLRVSPLAASDGVEDRLKAKGERQHVMAPSETLSAPTASPVAPTFVGAGSALAGQLLRSCLSLGVTLLLETPAKTLLVDDGRVVGARAEHEGRPLFVRARHGVLLASGGFAHNEELKRLWLDRPLEYSCEIEENEGDGHLMGMAIGAQVAGLGDAWWMMQGAGHFNRYVPHTLIVNRDARRFCDEGVNYYDFGLVFGTKRDSPDGTPRNLPAWLIFDSQGTRKYAVLANIPIAFASGEGVLVGSGPSATSRSTNLTTADTLEEMAEKLEIDAATFADTVERFNGYARDGYDPEFHRGESRWVLDAFGDPNHKPNPSLGTVEEAPFYAVEIRSGALATRGGLRVNGKAEVLAASGEGPIPGLYAAGNCSNCATPMAYPGPGATIGAAMTYGFLAAMEIAARAKGALAAGAETEQAA